MAGNHRVFPPSPGLTFTADRNETALATIRTDKTFPPKAARALAILRTSIYDARSSPPAARKSRKQKPHESFHERSRNPGSAFVPSVGRGVPSRRTSCNVPTGTHAATRSHALERSFRRDVKTNV